MKPARSLGFTLIELLIVMAILAILFSLTALNGRKVVEEQNIASFFTGVKQIFWRGASLAASEGKTLDLWKAGSKLEIKDGSGKVRMSLQVPSKVTLSLNDGKLATFLPPGKVDLTHFPKDCVSNPSFQIRAPKRTACLQVSVIGEVEEVTP